MSYLHNKLKAYIKDTSEGQDTFKIGVHGHSTIYILQNFDKRNKFI